MISRLKTANANITGMEIIFFILKKSIGVINYFVSIHMDFLLKIAGNAGGVFNFINFQLLNK